ncbi:MAG: YraN family protein [Candidatus Tectomicrobia bacterium]|uniref:UPF0102 protein HY730_09880 n=1 Tax=Tectimicrobiota bacterium TaxID=2528274 RepID=A0A933GMI9_UNCTE|nr:YraN family protein [Candidatus Tectomicrobia bacterium]
MGDRRQEIGRKGEQVAEKFLKSSGYKILERNYRCPAGEIDIIAEEKGILVFTEVRTLSGEGWGLPQMSISFTKQKKIVKTSLYYLSEKRLWDRTCRFDVVAVTRPGEKEESIELLRGAFEAEE